MGVNNIKPRFLKGKIDVGPWKLMERSVWSSCNSVGSVSFKVQTEDPSKKKFSRKKKEDKNQDSSNTMF